MLLYVYFTLLFTPGQRWGERPLSQGNGIDGSYDSPHSLRVLAKYSILFHIHTLGASHGPLWAFAWSPGCLCNIEVTESKDQGRCCSLTYLLLTQPLPAAHGIGRIGKQKLNSSLGSVELEWGRSATPHSLEDLEL